MFSAEKKDGTLQRVVVDRGLDPVYKGKWYGRAANRRDVWKFRSSKVSLNKDLRTVFHQILIYLDDNEKTAFTTKYGQLELTILAIEVCNALPRSKQSWILYLDVKVWNFGCVPR